MGFNQNYLFMLIFLVYSTQTKSIKCSKDVTMMYQKDFIPIQKQFDSQQQNSLHEFDENENNTTIIGFYSFKKKQQNIKTWSFFIQDIFYIFIQKSINEDYFQIMIHKMKLSVEDNVLQNLIFFEIKKQNIELQNCLNIRELFLSKLNIYSLQTLLLFCDYGNLLQIFWLEIYDQAPDTNIVKPNYLQQLPNNRNCNYKSLQFDSKFVILSAELNCQEWKIYTFNHEGKELLAEQFDLKILRNINIINEIVYLIFDHDIYSISVWISRIIVLENSSNNYLIINFLAINQAFYKILFESSNQTSGQNECVFEQVQQYNCIFLNNYPEDIFVLNQKLLIKMNENQYFIYRNPYFRQLFEINIPLKHYGYKFWPFLFGIQDEIIYVIKVKEFSPYFNCDNYINNTEINFYEFTFTHNQNETQKLEMKFFQGQIEQKIDKFQLSNNVIIKNSVFTFNLHNYEIMNMKYFNQITFNINKQLSCNILQIQIQQVCQLQDERQILWQEYYILNQFNFIIFQTYDSKIYMLECQENKTKQLDIVNQITNRKIFRIQKYFVILYKNSSNLFIINFISYPQIYFKHYAFDQSVVKITKAMKNTLIVILQNKMIMKVSNQLMQIAKEFYDDEHPCDEVLSYQAQENLVCLHNQQMIFQQLSYTIITTFQEGKILSSIFIDSVDDFILLLEKQNTINFYKYSIFDFQFVNLFKLPLSNYTMNQPIKYIENGKYLILQAKQSTTSLNVLLIYNLSNDIDDILYDIILDVDDGDFQFISEESFYYQKGSIHYYSKIDEIEVQCELKDKDIILECIELEFNISSQLYLNQQTQKGILQVNIDNQIESLRVKNQQKLNFYKSQDFIYLDIRHLVIGKVVSIKSNDYDIVFPIMLKQQIFSHQCSNFQSIYCIDQKGNYIQNIFTLQKFEFKFQQNSIVYLLEENIYEIYYLDNGPNLRIYQNFSLLSYDSILQQNEQPAKILVTKQNIFIFYSRFYQIYEIQQTNLKLISEQLFVCNNCIIKYVTDNKLKFIIYNSYQFNIIHCLYIEQSENNFSSFNLQIIDARKIPINSDSLIKINQIYESDNQINVVLIYKLIESDIIQIYEGIINKIDKYLILGEVKVNIRTFQSKSIDFESLSDDIIYTKSQNNINFYNISNYSEFKIIDPIYSIQSNAQEIKIINDTYFLLFSSNDGPHQIYEIKSYQIKLKNQGKAKNTLIIYNNISEVEFEISYQKEASLLNFSWKSIVTIGVFSIMITLITFLIRRFFLLRGQKTTSTDSEIFQNLSAIK